MMKPRLLLPGLMLLAGLVTIGAARGPECPCSGGGRALYNRKTEITMEGAVVNVETVACRRMSGSGTHITLRADGQPVRVHLGPSRFLEEKGLTIAEGDAMTITGSKVTCKSSQYVIAREVRRGELTVTLRDERGVPEWAGSGRRRGPWPPEE